MEKAKLGFTVTGLTGAGSLLLINEVMGLVGSGIKGALSLSASILAGGIVLDLVYRDNKYEKLFRLCGIVNKDGQVPLVIKKQKVNEHEKNIVIHMPAGISQEHFEKKKQELEQFLNARIEFGFNENLVMKLTEITLATKCPYIFEPCNNPLEVYAGETNSGKFYLDIEKCPHILVAGETGSGKSMFLDNVILSLLLNSHDIELHLIDFQAVTLGKYENCRKVKSYGETPEDFDKLLAELEEENSRRLKLFRSVKNKIYIDNLRMWNEKFPSKAMPYKVVVVDEFARLAEKQYEDLLEKFRTRVSMDRKVGIHYIIALQRPDVKMIEGSIKANIPTRIAFKTVSAVDSKVILDQEGAEALTNPGRCIMKYHGEYTEVQGLYASGDMIRSILKKNKLYKTQDEIAFERREEMKRLREKCINPYLR